MKDSHIRFARAPLAAIATVVLASSLASAQHVVNRSKGQGPVSVTTTSGPVQVSEMVPPAGSKTDGSLIAQVQAALSQLLEGRGGQPLPSGPLFGTRTGLGVYDR